MKILVIDDHKGFRQEVAAILTRHGYRVEEADSAEAAIPLAESGGFDFVLVDFSMPRHDGLWFMQHVHLPQGTKALLATAHVQREMIDRMFKLGASGYIIKPFGEDDLLRHLQFHDRSRRTETGPDRNIAAGSPLGGAPDAPATIRKADPAARKKGGARKQTVRESL